MPNLQIAGKVYVEIECKPDWSECQKDQARTKAADLNHQCTLTHDTSYGAATKAAKARAQSEWTERFYDVRAGRPTYKCAELGPSDNNYPWGDSHDFTHPCMEAEMVNGQAPTHNEPGGRTVSNWAADHRTECIAGGSTQGPIKMLDYRVNSTFGATMEAAVKMGPVESVRLVGC